MGEKNHVNQGNSLRKTLRPVEEQFSWGGIQGINRKAMRNKLGKTD